MGWWSGGACATDTCIQAAYYNSILDKGEEAWNCVYGTTDGGPFASIPRVSANTTAVCANDVNLVRGYIDQMTDPDDGGCTQCTWDQLDDPCPQSRDVVSGVDPICVCDYFCLENALDCIIQNCCGFDCGCIAPNEINIYPNFEFITGCHDQGGGYSEYGPELKCSTKYRMRLTSVTSEYCSYCGLMDDVPECMGYQPYPDGPPQCSGCTRSGCEYYYFSWRVTPCYSDDCTNCQDCFEQYYPEEGCKYWLEECQDICWYVWPTPPECAYSLPVDNCVRKNGWRSSLTITKIRDGGLNVIGVNITGGVSRILASWEDGNCTLFYYNEDIYFDDPEVIPNCCDLLGVFLNRAPYNPPPPWPIPHKDAGRFQDYHPIAGGTYAYWFDTPDMTFSCE